MIVLLWTAVLIENGLGLTLCEKASSIQSLPVSLCYETSASARSVVLDGSLTHNSSTSLCHCALTSTQRTSVRFTALNALQPGYTNCGSSITVAHGGMSFTINCYVLGKVSVSPTQTVSLLFDKPGFAYDSRYCTLLTSDNSSVVLTLKCKGDSYPTTTSKPTTASLLESGITAGTYSKPDMSTPQSQTALWTTTAAMLTTISNQTTTTTSSKWRYTIPAAGAGFVLTFALVFAVWYNHRRVHKSQCKNKNEVIDCDNQTNLPYSPDFGRRQNRISNLSEATDVYDEIDIVNDARDNASVLLNTNEENVAYYTLPMRNDLPMNVSINESYLTPYEICIETNQTRGQDLI